MKANVSVLQQQAARVALGLSGQKGNTGLFPIDDNKIVTTTNMKVGAYTIAAQPSAASLLSVTVTAVGTADTMGTITFVGTDFYGNALTEEVTPVADDTVYTTNAFKTVTSATGAGWVIDAVEGTEDTIIIGVADVVAPSGFYISSMIVVSAAVVASQTDKSGSINTDYTSYTSIPVGTYPMKVTQIALTSGEAVLTLSEG